MSKNLKFSYFDSVGLSCVMQEKSINLVGIPARELPWSWLQVVMRNKRKKVQFVSVMFFYNFYFW